MSGKIISFFVLKKTFFKVFSIENDQNFQYFLRLCRNPVIGSLFWPDQVFLLFEIRFKYFDQFFLVLPSVHTP